MADEFIPLSVQTYSQDALATDVRRDAASLSFPLLGLFGEVGSLLSEVKKKQRDPISYRAYAAAVNEELGDVLWYFNLVATKAGVPLAEVVANLVTTEEDDWASAPSGMLTFEALQPAVLPTSQNPTAAFEATLIELAAAVGRLMDDQRASDLSRDRQRLRPRLVAILEVLIRAATEAGVTLEAAAVANLSKTRDRWPVHKTYPPLFDGERPREEQLPRSRTIDIFERDVGGKHYVFQTCNGINIGDRLTDNAMTPDDYRYHDVFHYAYVAVLGWSPVTRRLFKLKRKSTPLVDEAEDGARAALIEEGITTWIFGQAMEMNFFKDVKPGSLPFDLLKQVRKFVSGYEAEACPAWLWEEAILQGYEAFRYLRKHRRGRVHLDTENRRLTIEPFE